jgi:hypothetical protein
MTPPPKKKEPRLKCEKTQIKMGGTGALLYLHLFSKSHCNSRTYFISDKCSLRQCVIQRMGGHTIYVTVIPTLTPFTNYNQYFSVHRG